MRLLGRLAVAMTVVLVAAPLAAQAPGGRKIPRVGIVAATSATLARHQVDAFREGLRELGYVDGQSIAIEERWGEGKAERFRDLITELQQARVDVIVVASATGAKVAKWVQVAKDALPRISSVAALAHTEHPVTRLYARGMETAARTLGLRLQVVEVGDAGSLDRALSTVAATPPGALIITASPFFGVHRKKIAEFALARSIPTVGYDRQSIADGVLISYGPSLSDSYRRGAAYVDRILRGAKPADLPVEQSTTFELAINLRTARALGLTLPPTLLARADHVLE